MVGIKTYDFLKDLISINLNEVISLCVICS